MYLAVCTRPEISFTLSQLSQHLKAPGINNWRAVLHLMWYLSGTKHFGIMLDGNQKANQLLESGLAKTQYVSTNNQLANLCTKALGKKKHEEDIKQLNITGS
ncbi:uncharacterized protein VP01_2477g1 [Puccinia sorghi]|uniref:Uncharacterized protein n=1 Tax=Puccinia sorghi TaxID=27349 RepID=A0A0L6V6J8_9BASI|nr:uncharacterized protein VP01_2477g1 [Puccinia sorghi]